MGGTLSSYARSHKIFIKTAPNTFGLIELGVNGNSGSSPLDESGIEDLPETFGKT